VSESLCHIVMAVANNTYPSDVRVRNEALTLVNEGYKVTVVAPRGSAQSAQETVDGVHVLRYNLPTFGQDKLAYVFEFMYVTLVTMLLVTKLWLSENFDVLHVHNPPDTLFFAGIVPRLFGKKFVFDHHDLAPELFLAKYETKGVVYSALCLLERLSCQLATHVITVNESYKANDVSRNKKRAEDIVVVRNGPHLNHLELPEPDPELRQKASILFGYLGHISKQDGVDHLIQALYHLKNDFDYDDWFCVIIGPADDLEPLTTLAQDLELSEKILFTGFLPDTKWRKALASVDICVVPDPENSLNEKSTMIKLMEYMALGKATVAYDMTENRFSGGDATLYAQASDPVDLARQFSNLVHDEQLRAKLGEKGRARIRASLAWEFSAEQLVGLYKRICGE